MLNQIKSNKIRLFPQTLQYYNSDRIFSKEQFKVIVTVKSSDEKL